MNRRHRKLIKKILTVLLCVIAVLSCIALQTPGSPVENATDEILTVGVPVDRCPVFYQDPQTKEILGIGTDLMRTAAEAAGYTAVFKAVEEETLKDALDNEAYDVVMPFGSAINSASGHPTIVSDNLLQTPFTLVTRENEELPPLNELRVGMLRSLSGGAETVQQLYPGIEITFYETMSDCVKALRADEVDALLHNSYVWSYVLQKPAYSELKVQPGSMFSMDFRAGTLDTPEGRVIIDRLNEGIAALPETRRQAVILDYTSRQLYQKDLSDFLYQYGLLLLLGVLLIAALIVISILRSRAFRLEQEKKMRQLIDNDPLTGALSLNGFRKKVEELLRSYPDTPYFLSYNNIRDFKYINNSLGRSSGDDLLKFWVSKSLGSLTNEEAIGRIEADHFAVLRHIESEEKMSEDERNVFEPVQNFFIDQGKEFRVQICSGIYVLTPKDFRKIDVDHMLDLARVAEKKVRDNRKDNHAFYNPEQWERGKRLADIINFLPKAIEAGDLFVWYQPQVDFETGKMIGSEALCRWDHDKLGFLYPFEFIEILEESGLIYDLDSFVWNRVCQDLQRWNRQGEHRSVSVNISRCDFQESRDIPGQFYNLIQTYGLTPDQLRLEITETAYAEDPALLINTTNRMRELGFQVEMDDFGSGYSSLHMLKEVPVDRIKLDLHFLTDSGDPEKGRIIVSYMIRMIHSLGMNLIAEGVETAEQASFLYEQGCHEMQGYYFYKPMPVQDFEKIADAAPDTTQE